MANYVKEKNKISDIFVNVNNEKKKVVSTWVNKDGVPTKVFGSKSPIPSIWSTGTWDEISDLLNRHYAGEINIEDYFNVGDERVVHLSKIENWNTEKVQGTWSSVIETIGEEQPEQDITLVIIGINLDVLKDQEGVKNHAAITVQTKNCLTNKGIIDYNYFVSTEYKTIPFTELKWENCDRRNWCNNQFYNSLPLNIKNLIKTVSKSVYNFDVTYNEGVYYLDNSIKSICYDKCFLLSRHECTGFTDKNEIQYSYFYGTNWEERRKKNGIRWWLRDPYVVLKSFNDENKIINIIGWYDMYEDNQGSTHLSMPEGIAPAFCL